MSTAALSLRERNVVWRVRWWKLKNFFQHRWREYPLELALCFCRLLTWLIPGFNMPWHVRWYFVIRRANGEIWNLGHIGCRLVTTVGKEFVVDAWRGTKELEDMKYHAHGTDATAAAVGQTALISEIAGSQYSTGVRIGGTPSAPSSGVYRSVAATTFAGTSFIARETGLFSQAALGGGTMFDREVYAALTFVSQDTFTSTMELTHS